MVQGGPEKRTQNDMKLIYKSLLRAFVVVVCEKEILSSSKTYLSLPSHSVQNKAHPKLRGGK